MTEEQYIIKVEIKVCANSLQEAIYEVTKRFHPTVKIKEAKRNSPML